MIEAPEIEEDFDISENIIPYEYQDDVVQRILDFLREANRPDAKGFVVMPGGSGKTIIFSDLVRRLGKKAIVVSPTNTILYQNVNRMKKLGTDLTLSVYNSDEKDLSGDVVYTTNHSLLRLVDSGIVDSDFCGIVIYDEGHRNLSDRRSEIPEKLVVISLAFTATDKFSLSKNVENVFENEIYRMALREAVERGILLPLRGYIVETHIDVRGLKFSRGKELDEKLANRHLNVPVRNQVACDYYLKNFKGKPAVTFCVGIQHSNDMAKLFRSHGIRASAVHSKVPQEKRDKIIEGFDCGKIDILCTPNLLIEGWDSDRVEVALNLRPTYSWVIAEQRACRVTRTMEGKKCGIVVEFDDIYDRSSQPIFIHHLFGLRTYRQGGYVIAPKKVIEKEAKTARRYRKRYSADGLQISTTVRKVVDLNAVIYGDGIQDKDLVKEILMTRRDINYARIRTSDFLATRFYHTMFRGSGARLMKLYLGLRHNFTAEDYRLFLADVLGEVYEEKIVSYQPDLDCFVGQPADSRNSFEYREGLSIEVGRALSTLTEREKDVVSWFFGIGIFRPFTLMEIAEKFDLTRERVRSIKEKALRRLRHTSRSKHLVEYLGYGD
jgi:RNA polymerase sigma factor (sigma-70 family)